jgi:hypothetical protein
MLSDIFTPPTAIAASTPAAFAGCRFHDGFLMLLAFISATPRAADITLISLLLLTVLLLH